jgi:hypothetical protein
MKFLKNIFYIIYLIFPPLLFSQDIEVILNQTTRYAPIGTVEIILDFKVVNISPVQQTFFEVRTINNLPTGWLSSLCFETLCYSPYVDSIATTPNFGFNPLEPGDTLDTSVHFFTDLISIATGYVQLEVGTFQHPQNKITIDFVGTTDPTVLIPIVVMSPNGGENWQIYSSQHITWQSNGLNNVKIEYSTNNGSSWQLVVNNYPANSGNYNWVIPNTPSNACRVKISDVQNPATNDISDNNFSILNLPDSTFTLLTTVNLTGVTHGSAVWGDYDGDGDLDILLSGNFATKIYRNNGNNTFSEQTSISLTEVGYSAAAWGDYDNDGDLDILLTGNASVTPPPYEPISKIYRNNGNNTFTEQTSISLTGVYLGAVAWGDYDNDGDSDILLAGRNAVDGDEAKIYRNEGNNNFLEQSSISLTGVSLSSLAWGDYDNDGDLDILLIGDSFGFPVSKIYRNEGDNSFTEQTSILLADVGAGSVAWGDYDNDGDLDILLTGRDINFQQLSKIYRNNGNNTFTEQTSISLMGVENSRTKSSAWGDYDNDGDLDILLTGYDGIGAYSMIYRNNGDNTFTEMTAINLIDVFDSCVDWGDFDNDGDIDILITGSENGAGGITKIYRNNNATSNILPTIPANLSSISDSTNVTLSWSKSTDNETPQDGLKYNIVVGTNPGAVDIVSPMSNRITGYRRVVEMGNTNCNNSWTIKGLVQGIYYWSVQAIDNNFAGSNFSTEKTFNILQQNNITVISPNGGEVWQVGSTQNITWNSTNVLNVKIELSTNNGASWTSIVDSTPSTGIYSWTVPNTPSNTCKVKVSDINNPLVYDESDGGFTIIQTAFINVNSPNGGEVWSVGSIHNITWNSTDVLDVKIELSTNNGASWTTVADSTPSSGIFSWTVPNTPSIQSLIKISDINNSSTKDESDSLFTIDPVVNTNSESIPEQFALYQNYPNPFNPSTTIHYQISELSFVVLKIFDVMGNEIATLVNEEKFIGGYEVELDASTLPSGVYFYRLQAGSFVETKKMVLMK